MRYPLIHFNRKSTEEEAGEEDANSDEDGSEREEEYEAEIDEDANERIDASKSHRPNRERPGILDKRRRTFGPVRSL